MSPGGGSGFSGVTASLLLQPKATKQRESKLSFSNHFIVSSECQKERRSQVRSDDVPAYVLYTSRIAGETFPNQKESRKTNRQRPAIQSNRQKKESAKGVDEGIRTPDPQNHNLML